MTEFLDSLSKEDWDFIKTSFSFQSDREAMKYSLIHSIEQRIIREEVFNGTLEKSDLNSSGIKDSPLPSLFEFFLP